MIVWMTVSVERDDKLLEVARLPFNVADDEALRRLYVTKQTTTLDQHALKLSPATQFDFAFADGDDLDSLMQHAGE